MTPARIAFVVGCARSGTTWIGRSLAASPGFRVTIERQPQFQLVDQMALDFRRRRWLMPALVATYESELRRSGELTYVDKSHQAIWLAEPLLAAFPDARFVAIQRSAYGTVASMVGHDGVLAHFDRWRSYPLPNRHVGVEPGMHGYDALPLVAKCALRWRSHSRRIAELRGALGERVVVIDYERAVRDPEPVREQLRELLGREIAPIDADRRPLERWRAVLSRGDRRLIDSIVAGSPEGASAQSSAPANVSGT